MLKKLFPIALLFAIAVCPAWLQAKGFEGTVSMRMTAGNEPPVDIAYSIKPGKIRVETHLGEGQTATAIMDFERDKMLMLLPNQPMYMSLPIKKTLAKAKAEAEVDRAESAALIKTNQRREILGHTCVKYIYRLENGETEIWATDELGTFMGLGKSMGRSAAPKSGWEQALMGKSFFPLLVIGSRDSGETFRMEATAVEPKSLPDSLFAAPAGYHEFSLGGMMKGLFNR